eukprot:4079638-Pleurochrysis_carterae.AAC.1
MLLSCDPSFVTFEVAPGRAYAQLFAIRWRQTEADGGRLGHRNAQTHAYARAREHACTHSST